MYHSVTFGEKNSWTDWHLVASSRPVISPPPVKTQYVEIPGADGSIDLTDALAGRPAYGDREGSIDFVVLNDYNLDNYDYNWIDVYTSIMQYLHGRRMTMVLEDDPLYYYEGRFSVNSWKSDQNNSTITIDYRVSPYKYVVVPQFSIGEFERGAFTIDESTGAINEFDDADAKKWNVRTKADNIRAYNPGDAVRISEKYHLGVWMYDRNEQGLYVGKRAVFSSAMYGKRYEFTDSGFFRISVYKQASIDTPIQDEEIPAIADSIRLYTGGVL